MKSFILKTNILSYKQLLIYMSFLMNQQEETSKLHNQALQFFKAGHFKNAIDFYEQAIKINPQYAFKTTLKEMPCIFSTDQRKQSTVIIKR